MRIVQTLWRGIAAFFSRVTRGTVRETLAAFPRTTDAPRPTHAEWVVSVFAATGVAADVRRSRIPLRWGIALLVRAVEDATRRHLRLQAHLADPTVVKVAAAAEAARDRFASGARWVTDGRVPRLLLLIVQPSIVIADWTFFSSLLVDTWGVSLQQVTPAGLPQLVAALALPLVLPCFVLACAAYAGHRLALRRARRIDADRADGMLGGSTAAMAAVPWLTVLVVAAASGYFFVVGLGRFQSELDDAGSAIPAPVLAVLFGALPLMALVLETLSSQPLQQHDAATLRLASRFDRAEQALRRAVLHAQAVVLRRWLRLAQRVARIAASANLSEQALEQEIALSWARSGSFGGLTPTVAQPAAAARHGFPPSHRPAVPDLAVLRGIELETAPRVLDELRPVLQTLTALRPDRWDSPVGMAEWLVGLGTATAPVTRIDGEEPQEVVA